MIFENLKGIYFIKVDVKLVNIFLMNRVKVMNLFVMIEKEVEYFVFEWVLGIVKK